MTPDQPVDEELTRRPAPNPGAGWRSRFWVIAAFAALTLVAADLVAWTLAPPRHLREVEDAVADLERGDPTVLAIGSSHARTFHVMADSLRARTSGRESMLAVPVEWGKLSAYQWVLERRLLPLFNEPGANGRPKRQALRRAIIITEWWDSCEHTEMPKNMPARSWTWRDYVADVRAHGLTDYNGNFLAYRWSRFWRWSALVQDRGHNRIMSAARQRIAPSSPDAIKANFDRIAGEWQVMLEEGIACLGSDVEMDAFTAMIDTLTARQLEVTVLLYPRMPVTMTARTKETTLPAFKRLVQAITEPRGLRLIDLSDSAPLTDADFGGDFDHILPAGNERFSGWALDGPFRFLVDPTPMIRR